MQAQETQLRIMSAAVAVFGQYGYKKTTMQDIADEAGLSRPAVYQYYKNKAAVFHGLLVDVFSKAKSSAMAQFESTQSLLLV
ncbi:TetR/AcrR family transcriptional regulator [Vibrio sonorensis]|uniref:TetR/AcrR family transcriptional regulator n=1 Tax=Vibrio sonorensis TaxID=1004316 RepID=UPI0008D9F5BF|nr:helix-turn-helix domain-containing protein [Vibrio sonorensis]